MRRTIMPLFITCSLLFLAGCNPIENVHNTANLHNSVASAAAAQQGKTPQVVSLKASAVPTWTADPAHYETAKTSINRSLSVPILEYHEANYVPGDIATLKPGQFAEELRWLHDHGFHTINFGQLYAAIYRGYQLPSRPVLITFDDGYESVYFKVFPLLKQYNYQATLFIVSGYTHDQPDRQKKFPTLTTSELQEMQKSGLVDIEDHTMTHRNLSTLSDAEATEEIAGSAKILAGIVHHPMLFFCYPEGGYTQRTVDIVKKSGYLLAVTQHQTYANITQGPWTLHRLTVLDTTTLAQFAWYLNPSLRNNS